MKRGVGAHGFTIPELLVALGVTATLLILSAIFVHPKDFSAADRNAQRWTNVAQLMQIVNRYVAATGALPSGLPGSAKVIASDGFDLCKITVPAVAKDLPNDATNGLRWPGANCRDTGTADNPLMYDTGYDVVLSNDRKLTIFAPHTDNGAVIGITRQF